MPDVPPEDRFGNYMLRNASVSVRKLDIAAGSSISVPASTPDYLVIALDASTIKALGRQQFV